ncbi:spore germination protein, partial [Ruminococcaceae bacterium OttesenSCG-928-N02]|nr:spore germination protein [Ruminococcaceae bacterium OttesenSCG-928-N02]
FGAQQKASRSVGEPSGEGNLRGSREGFAEILQLNMALIRRRVRSEKLRIETMTIGSESKTDIAIFYMHGMADAQMVSQTKKRLSEIKLSVIFDAGYLAPYIKRGNLSLFSGMGYTERPDTLAAKICEGKIGILVDGSPFALLVPYLFTENFHSMDDYTTYPFFASFVRLLKYVAFFMSILLPGFFVSAVNYTPHIVPVEVLFGIMQNAQKTPLPLFAEALLVIFILEIIREAGLRMPKPLGHSLALLAALIVGDAAVQTGLITSVSLVVLALTSISTFTVPALYEATTVLRILFVLAGGFFGPVGMVLGVALLLFNLTAVNVYDIPYTAPLTPLSEGAFDDGILRASLKKIEKNKFILRNFLNTEHSKNRREDED